METRRSLSFELGSVAKPRKPGNDQLNETSTALMRLSACRHYLRAIRLAELPSNYTVGTDVCTSSLPHPSMLAWDNNRSAGNSAAPSFGGGGSRPKGVSDHHLFLLALCVPRTYKLCTNLLSKRFRFSSLFFFFFSLERNLWKIEEGGGREGRIH